MRKPKQKYSVDEIVQRRLDSLEWLIDHEYDKSPKTFQDRTGITMTQVNQWFSGYRALRDKALKRLEEKTRKKPGWFDVVHAAASLKAPTLQAIGVDESGGAVMVALPEQSAKQLSQEAAQCAVMIDQLRNSNDRAMILAIVTQEVLARMSPGHRGMGPGDQAAAVPTPPPTPKRGRGGRR